MTTEKLYPVDYIEPEPEPKPVVSRDEAGALDLIRRAVPKGGAPLTTDELVALVCGRYVRGAGGELQPIGDAPDASVDLPAALVALAARGPLKGPAAFASFTVDEVVAFVEKVADERRATWKLLDAAAAAVVEVGEVEPK